MEPQPFLNLFLVPTGLVPSQLHKVLCQQPFFFGVNLVYQSWALCLAEDLSTSRGCEVFVNVGVIAVWLSTTLPNGTAAHWERTDSWIWFNTDLHDCPGLYILTWFEENSIVIEYYVIILSSATWQYIFLSPFTEEVTLDDTRVTTVHYISIIYWSKSMVGFIIALQIIMILCPSLYNLLGNFCVTCNTSYI